MTDDRLSWDGAWPKLLPHDFGRWLLRRFVIYLAVAAVVAMLFFVLAAWMAGCSWVVYVMGALCLLAVGWQDLPGKIRLRH